MATATASIVKDQIADVRHDVDCLNEWVNGNGKPGAKATLALLEQRLAVIEKSLERQNGYIIGLMITVIGAELIRVFV